MSVYDSRALKRCTAAITATSRQKDDAQREWIWLAHATRRSSAFRSRCTGLKVRGRNLCNSRMTGTSPDRSTGDTGNSVRECRSVRFRRRRDAGARAAMMLTCRVSKRRRSHSPDSRKACGAHGNCSHRSMLCRSSGRNSRRFNGRFPVRKRHSVGNRAMHIGRRSTHHH